MTKFAPKESNLSKYRRVSEITREESVRLSILFLISLLLIVGYFVKVGSLVQGVDSLMWVTNADYYKGFNWMFSWYERTSLGFARTPTLLEIALGLITNALDPSWAYRVAVLMIVLIANLGSYQYIKHLTGSSNASLVGAFFYVSNPWFFHEITDGHIDILAGVGLFPWLLLVVEKRKLVLTAIVASVFVTAAHPQDVYAFGFLFIAYLIATLRVNRRDVSYFLSVSLFTIGLSMFYVEPFALVNGFGGFSGLTPWTIEDITGFIMPLWLVVLILGSVLFISILVLKYARGLKHSQFFAFAAIFTAFLASSPTLPILDGAYLWMFRNLPFFSIFRVPSRFLMTTTLCTACMIGMLASRTHNLKTTVKMPFWNKKVPKDKTCGAIIVTLLVATFIIGSSNPLKEPLFGNYTPDPEWISNYQWLRTQPSNLGIVYTLPVTSGWINTPYGNTQDYGALSTLFSGKPVVGTPSKTAASYPLLEYLQRSVLDNTTDQWLKLLGSINVEYVTTCGPNIGKQKAFLANQEGFDTNEAIYTYKGTEVYENPYWAPMFKIVPDVNLLVGGYDDLDSLLRLSLNLSSSSLQFLTSQEKVDQSNHSSLIYEDFMDYLMLTIDKGVRIHAYQFGVDYTRDPKNDWIKEDQWKIDGLFVFNGLTLSVSGDHSLVIPFAANEDGEYRVFARVLSGPAGDRGRLTISNVTLLPLWSSHSFKWYDFGQTEVVNGQGSLALSNEGGRNDIDEIVLVKQKDFDNQLANVSEELRSYSGQIALCNKASNVFNASMEPGWTVIEDPFSGEVLHGSGFTELSSPLTVGYSEPNSPLTVPPSTTNSVIVLRAKTGGNIMLQVDNMTVTTSSKKGYNLYTFYLPPLSEGFHYIRLYFMGETNVDYIMISSPSKNGTSIEEALANAESYDRVISVQKVNSAKYVLNVENTKAGSYLVTSISYDGRWRAFIDGVEICPTRMNDVLLSFPLNRTGTFQLLLDFVPQQYVTTGYSVTVATCLLTLALLPVRRLIKMRKRSRNIASRSLLALI